MNTSESEDVAGDEVVDVGQYAENERPVAAWCDPQWLHVRLADERAIATPLWWYPPLLAATQSQRNDVELMLDGVYWPAIDEGLSTKGMLRGWKAPGATRPGAVEPERSDAAERTETAEAA